MNPKWFSIFVFIGVALLGAGSSLYLDYGSNRNVLSIRVLGLCFVASGILGLWQYNKEHR